MENKEIRFIIPLHCPSSKRGRGKSNFNKMSDEYIPKCNIFSSDDMLHVDVVFHRIGRIPTGDIDNSLKILFDAIKKRVFPDDGQIISVNARIVCNSPEVKIDISVKYIGNFYD